MEWMLDILKELAEKFKPQLVEKVRNELCSRDLLLFDYVFQEYYAEIASGRWYDPYHVAYSTLFAVQLVKAGEASPLIVPAIILHDIGYCSPLVDKENWASPNSRIIHMQEGAAIAAKILVNNGGFSAKEIGEIVGLVASHDNGYLGIKTSGNDRLALRDADRVWVMHPLSFYKDWFSKMKKGEDLLLTDLFQSRLRSFYGSDEITPLRVMRATNLNQEDAVQSPSFVRLAKKWREVQFRQRFKEICDFIILDCETFRKSLEDNIAFELEAGRG